jgi:hypothetical protein
MARSHPGPLEYHMCPSSDSCGDAWVTATGIARAEPGAWRRPTSPDRGVTGRPPVT